MRIHGWRGDTRDLTGGTAITLTVMVIAFCFADCMRGFAGSIGVEQAGKRVPNAVVFEYKLIYERSFNSNLYARNLLYIYFLLRFNGKSWN